MNPRVFREYDIRGVADRDFPDDFVTDLGKAIGTFLLDGGAKTMTLGRDCRVHSPRIHGALRAGLLSTGIDVIDVGILHSPGAPVEADTTSHQGLHGFAADSQF